MKFLNFSITEETGRTFEIPYDKALELIEEIKADNKHLADEKTSNEYEMAHFFTQAGLDEIAKYELDNDYFESTLTDVNLYETEEN